MTLRLLARQLRVLVACLALGVVWPPLDPAALSADAVAWIAGARAAAAVSAEASHRERAGRQAPRARPAARRNRQPAHGAPAGLREVVVRTRLYLHHEALLC